MKISYFDLEITNHLKLLEEKNVNTFEIEVMSSDYNYYFFCSL